jgi:hypothetical protein
MAKQTKTQEPGLSKGSLTISGLPQDLKTSPEKIRKVLEILELPEGIKVEILFQASTTMVR